MTVRRTIDLLSAHLLKTSVVWTRKETHTLEELLFQLGFGDLNLDGLVDLLLVSLFVVGVVLDRCREKCVDESGLAKTRFASNLDASR